MPPTLYHIRHPFSLRPSLQEPKVALLVRKLIHAPLVKLVKALAHMPRADLVSNYNPFVLLTPSVVLKVRTANPRDAKRRFRQPNSQRRILALVVRNVGHACHVLGNRTGHNVPVGSLGPKRAAQRNRCTNPISFSSAHCGTQSLSIVTLQKAQDTY